jgi:hypothetical protein
MSGLNDVRFEVRYHCSAAIDRIVSRNSAITLDHAHIIAVIERELSVPPQRWRGYRLLDRPSPDPGGIMESPDDASRYLEHVFQLLSTIIPHDALDAAAHGVRSPHAGVRGLALEYFDQVLPPIVLRKLRELLASTPSGDTVRPDKAVTTRSPAKH